MGNRKINVYVLSSISFMSTIDYGWIDSQVQNPWSKRALSVAIKCTPSSSQPPPQQILVVGGLESSLQNPNSFKSLVEHLKCQQKHEKVDQTQMPFRSSIQSHGKAFGAWS